MHKTESLTTLHVMSDKHLRTDDDDLGFLGPHGVLQASVVCSTHQKMFFLLSCNFLAHCKDVILYSVIACFR